MPTYPPAIQRIIDGGDDVTEIGTICGLPVGGFDGFPMFYEELANGEIDGGTFRLGMSIHSNAFYIFVEHPNNSFDRDGNTRHPIYAISTQDFIRHVMACICVGLHIGPLAQGATDGKDNDEATHDEAAHARPQDEGR